MAVRLKGKKITRYDVEQLEQGDRIEILLGLKEIREQHGSSLFLHLIQVFAVILAWFILVIIAGHDLFSPDGVIKLFNALRLLLYYMVGVSAFAIVFDIFWIIKGDRKRRRFMTRFFPDGEEEQTPEKVPDLQQGDRQ